MNIKENIEIINSLIIRDRPNLKYQLNECNHIAFRKNWQIDKRTIHDFLISYIQSGKGKYTYLDGSSDIIEKDTLYFLSPNVEHSAYYIDKVPSFYSIRFSILSKDNTNVCNLMNRKFHFSISLKESDHIRHTFTNLHQHTLLDNIKYKDAIADSSIHSILYDVLIQMETKEPSLDMRLENACIHARRFFLEGVTIEELANISNLSRDYFSRIFKAKYGISPVSYLVKLKMDFAKSQLSENHLTVKETAYICGYADPFQFSKQFKKTFGKSPSSYF